MSNELKVINIIFTNELNIDDLINDYAKFIATKLYKKRGDDDDEKKK